MSKEIRFKGIVATLAQIAADAFAGRISWASDLARPVHYYTDSDYAVLARKDVAETFPGVKITNQAGPVARMVQAGTDGTQSAVSAATARSTIGAQAALGYTPVNKDGDTMTGPLTLESTTGNARLAMSKDAIRVFEKGMFSIDNTVRESVYDDAGAWIDDVITYVRTAGGGITLGGAGATKRDVNLTKNLKLAGTVRLSAGGAGTLTSLVNSATAGVGIRPKVALADGTDAAQDAATFRGTIGAVAASEKGAANGVAPLGADSKIASTYLPSYVDDVLEFASLAGFPATGESGKIYVAIDTAKTYRWSGSAYVVISETLALGETSSTAYRGDRGKTAFDHSQATGNPHGTTAAQVGAQGYAEEYDSQTIAFTSNYNSPISPIHTFSANFFSKNKTVRIAGCINSGDLVGKQLKFLVDGASSFPFYTLSTGEQGFLFEIFIKCLTAPSSGNVDLLITGRITSSSSKLSESTINASYAVGSAHTIGISVNNAGASGSVVCYMWTVEQLSKGA